MTRRYVTLTLLACAAIGLACGGDSGMEPASRDTGEPAVARLDLSPATLGLDPGTTYQLTVVAGDERLQWVPAPATITYASDNAAVAAVSSTGLVTALGPGTAVISATITRGGVTRGARTVAHVLPPAAPGEVVLTEDVIVGWSPASVDVTTSDVVRWRLRTGSWDAAPSTLYLFRADGGFMDSLNLATASATRRFQTPGTISFCAHGCWGPAYVGEIRVR